MDNKKLNQDDYIVGDNKVLQAIIENHPQNGTDKGLRHNKGKIRYDLLEPFAIQELAKVFTKGAEKYADRNWEKGMKWSKMRASLGRHLAAYDNCEDFDIDPMCEDCRKGECKNHTGLYHIAQVAWNALGILSYYKLHPQGDDRAHKYLSRPRIGLDIDEVLGDWVGHWVARHGIQDRPEFWNFDRDIHKKFEEMKDDKEFWLTIPVKTSPCDIPFEPACYITSRSIPIEWTQEWLDKNKFPAVPVYRVDFEHSKVEVAKQAKIDWYVDDRYENFVELNNAGICTFLFDAPHNKRYNVGYKRIKSLKELI